MPLLKEGFSLFQMSLKKIKTMQFLNTVFKNLKVQQYTLVSITYEMVQSQLKTGKVTTD